MRVLAGSRFQPGPFHLGRWSPYISGVAVSWVVFITVCAQPDLASPPPAATAAPPTLTMPCYALS